MHARSRKPGRFAVLALAAVLAALAVGAPLAEAAKKKGKPKAPSISLMTRNIYLGGDIAKPIPAATPEEFAQLNGELWNVVQQTDFPSRAKLLALEIKRTKPHVIGLQEVATWRTSPQGQSDGNATPATIVAYDFLKLLQAALKDRGMNYRAAVVQQEADIEGPVSQGYDVRLTMHDVILVRKMKGLKVKKKLKDNYDAKLALSTQGGQVNVIRGWTAIDAVWKKKKFRFVNTHLEAFLEDIRVAQAKQLAAKGGPLRKKGTVFLVGDLNSDPRGDDNGNPAAYNVFKDAGFFDTWILKNKQADGYSCCMNQENILDPPPAPFDHRIDHVLVKPKSRVKVTRTRIVGNDPSNRTATGLWPSDHGGLVSTVKLKK